MDARTPDPQDVLARTPYVLLTTFRRTGTPVATPVWVVGLDGALAVWTNASAGKVKRVRHTSQVLLQPCSRTGVPTGRAVEGTAHVADESLGPRVLAAIGRKYGLAGRIAQLMTGLRSRIGALRGRPARPGVLTITVP